MPLPFSVLGFTGPATAGKTTAAMAIVASAPGICRVSFALPIRAMLQAMGLTAEELTEGKHRPCDLLGGKTPRHALQTLGTEWGRQMIADDLWLRVGRQRILRALETEHLVVVDDVRFDNEAEMIRALGGRIISLSRPGLVRLEHVSEKGVSPHLIDLSIEAEDVPALHSQVFAALHTLSQARS